MKLCLAMLAAALTLAACDLSTSPVGPDARSAAAPTTAPADAVVRYADAIPTFDDVLNDVSLAHPGFKGIVGTDDGQGVIILVGTEAEASDKASALAADLATRLGVEPARLRVEPATVAQARGTPAAERPDFQRLHATRIALRRFLFETDLVTSIDHDEVTGRVRVGVTASDKADAVREQLTPEERAHVDFAVVEPAVSLAGTEPRGILDWGREATADANPPPGTMRSLRDSRFTPLIAGTEINFGTQRADGSYPSCTVGPIVRYNNALVGFLTNSHCTPSRSSVNSDFAFSQPTVDGSSVVGRETAEQAYRNPFWPWQAHGYYADVAFVRSSNAGPLAGKAVTSSNCASGGACTESGIEDAITGASQYLPVNIQMYKTGRSTGTTGGVIERTCVDELFDDGFMTLCSNVVVVSPYGPANVPISFFGDSGSPVMRTIAPLPQREVAGILWGAYRNDQTRFLYSPWENITTTGRSARRTTRAA